MLSYPLTGKRCYSGPPVVVQPVLGAAEIYSTRCLSALALQTHIDLILRPNPNGPQDGVHVTQVMWEQLFTRNITLNHLHPSSPVLGPWICLVKVAYHYRTWRSKTALVPLLPRSSWHSFQSCRITAYGVPYSSPWHRQSTSHSRGFSPHAKQC